MSIFFSLSLVSFAAWTISTLTGGGSPFILIPLVNVLLGASAIAPVVGTGMLVANFQRSLWFWSYTNWTVTRWYLPGAILGAILGAYSLTQINLEWLPKVMGLFLLFMVALSFVKVKNKKYFQVRAWQFLPTGFVYAFISGLIGSSGPIMNPFYLHYGLLKEEMIGTKATNMLVLHVAKIVSYYSLGILTLPYFFYGMLIGISTLPANWVSQYVLQKMSNEQFRLLVLSFMAGSGIIMLL